ncbi:MAG: hypothetical protein HY961_02715 [Ignavibacteriae bacterium]|nr:hypothetical protein [Ignavibacteriota bacterium]
MEKREHVPVRRIVLVALFGIAFGFVESSVVVYLRALYYPDGFTFPLRIMRDDHIAVELLREAATIIMLAAIGAVAGRKGWQRFGYFLLAFGAWDIFYYIWLKLVLNWPLSLGDWDVLFLIPLPWIGPVISAAAIALLMTVCGVDIIIRISQQRRFSPTLLSWIMAILATASILYSFMSDTNATLRGSSPRAYRYELLIAGLLLYIVGYVLAIRTSGSRQLAK